MVAGAPLPAALILSLSDLATPDLELLCDEVVGEVKLGEAPDAVGAAAIVE